MHSTCVHANIASAAGTFQSSWEPYLTILERHTVQASARELTGTPQEGHLGGTCPALVPRGPCWTELHLPPLPPAFSVSLPHFLISLPRDHFLNKLRVLGSAAGRHRTKAGVTTTQMVKRRQRKPAGGECGPDQREVKWGEKPQAGLGPRWQPPGSHCQYQ